MTNPSIASDLIERLRDGEPIGDDFTEAADLLSQLTGRIETLFDAIAHGDDEHRAWLKEAIDAHFAGQPVPECRGKGRKEAALSQLTREVDERGKLLNRAVERLNFLGDDDRQLLCDVSEALSKSSGRVSDATE